MHSTSIASAASSTMGVINDAVLRSVSSDDDMFDIIRCAVNIAKAEQVQCLVKLRARLLTEFAGMEVAVDEAIGFWSRHVKQPW
jgi:hypothetical protein